MKVQKKGRRVHKTQTKVQVPVADQAETREGQRLNATKYCERRSDASEAGAARAAQGPVAERRSDTGLSGLTRQPVERREPLAVCTVAGTNPGV
jgi:hypothetical protein